MRSLRRRKDPAPSRFAFRVKRLWRSAAFRRAATLWAPLAVIAAGGAWAAMQPELRAFAARQIEETRAAVSERPEFAIRRIDVRGATPGVEAEVAGVLERWRGAPSLSADATTIRDEVAALGWVETARVRLEAPETLIVTVRERTPVAVWRRGETLSLIDAAGGVVAPIEKRSERRDLPLIAGIGAPERIAEARRVLAAATGVRELIRGLVRVGERRWDVILHEGPKIMLPAAGAVDAMGYLAALQAAEDVLARDVAAIDLRLKARPTLRLNPDAATALEAGRARENEKPKAPGEDA